MISDQGATTSGSARSDSGQTKVAEPASERQGSAVSPVADWAIGVLIKTRFVEFTRKPAAVFWTYVFPLVMMVVLGSAFRSQGTPTQPVAIVEHAQASALAEKLQPSPWLKVEVLPEEVAVRQLRTGAIVSLIRVARGAAVEEGGQGADSMDTGIPPWEVVYDPARPGGPMTELAIRQQLTASNQGPNTTPFQVVRFEEPGGRYIDFLVPGLIGMTLLGGGLWGVGYAIVDMRIRKLLKRYLATPMRKSDFLLGIVASRMLFMFPQVALILLVSRWVFGVINFGSWLELGLIILLGGLQFAGVGLLVASRTKTMESMSGLINLAMLPMWTLSGIFFSYQNFPEFLHWPIRLLPLTPILDAMRGVMLEGQSLTAFPVEMALILTWTLGTFLLALFTFRWND